MTTMQRHHYPTLKLHTIFSITVAILFISLMLLVREAALGLMLVFTFIYVAGNGLIHKQNNKLTRDTMIEYILVALVVLVILLDLLI